MQMTNLFRIEGITDKNNKLGRKVRGFLAGVPVPQWRKELNRTPRVVRAENVVRELTRERQQNEEPVYRLQSCAIEGDLNLKHRTVAVAIEIQDCTFLGNVDLSYCEFEQVVSLSGCTFCKEFKSGGELEAYTVYRKDLICNGTVFEQDVSFAGARVEGDAHFSRTTNENIVRNAHFRSKADFSTFKCSGFGFFMGARFEGGSGADFSYAAFGRSLNCQGSVFIGPADFWSVRCNDSAYFKKARFRSTRASLDDYAYRFGRASFGEQLHCESAVFKGPVDFYAMRCSGTAFFDKARFLFVREGGPDDENNMESKKPATEFTASHFGKQLDCRRAVFKGSVNFYAMECAGEGLFTMAQFQGDEHSFRFVSIDRNLSFRSCTFSGTVTDFRYLRVGGNLSFQNVYCETDFNLGHANIKYKLRFGGSRFAAKVELYNTRIGILELLDNNPRRSVRVRTDPSPGSLRVLVENEAELRKACKKGRTKQYKETWEETVNALYPFESQALSLADIRFERFHVGPPIPRLTNELALRFARGQDPTLFRRDPFRQLEQFFLSQGNETEAKRIYHEGRKEYRSNAIRKDGNADWGYSRLALDWLWKYFTGYGVAVGRLVMLAIGFLILGTLMFYAPDRIAVLASTHLPRDIGAFVAAHMPSHALDAATTSVEPKDWQDELPYRAAYSVDLFLPLVNLHIDEKWQPHGPVLQVYGIVHALVGWLIVPLLLAALAGIMRR